MEEEFRFGDNADEFFYHHYDVGYAYDVNKYLTLGMNYRRKIDKPQIPTPPGTFNINQHCALGAYESADP
ncbi:MAG: hypothetical protein KJ985_04050 [Proteobacteria bacterium]|nr:hypothetical protein [Pseudomonadota bacterium]